MSAVPTYIGGPSAPPGQVAETISGAFQRPGYDRAWMLTAITERTGIARLAPGLRQLRRNGAEVEGIVAIEPGAADAGNLYDVLKQIPTAYALTKPGLHRTGTYYYVAAGGDAATVVLGPPGLANTAEADPHESALLLELDLTDAADAALLQQLRAGFDRLIARTDICRPLTDDLVPELVAAAEEPLQPNPDRRATGEESGIAGFFKVLSRNDASLDHSPGQIIIPRRFLSFFSELTMGLSGRSGAGRGIWYKSPP
ncbi:MAG TPA: hypothetical protein VFD37_03335, partial [Solirubrobacterales bacterium]|nr:hypothetical protein [Solirubrobacterales bacterium]